MNQKQIGTIVVLLGLLLGVFVIMSYIKENQYIQLFMDKNEGSCYLDDGTCLHADRSYSLMIFGGILAGALIVLGVYLFFFDKTQKLLVEQNSQVSRALVEAKNKDEFNAFFSGFTSEEQSVLKAVHEQDGIKQSTLRFRTGMSKASLSLLLKSLEERDIIYRNKSGKTNEVYLRKKF